MAKGELLNQTKNQTSPAEAEASDFKSPGGPAKGFSSGFGKLVEQSANQEGPRHTSDGGSLTPSERGKAGQFAISVNKGEGGDGNPSTTVQRGCSVDLVSGKRTDYMTPKEL